MPTTCSTIVVAPRRSFGDAASPATGTGIGWVEDCCTSGDGPGVTSGPQRLQRSAVTWGRLLRGADLGAGGVVVGRPSDLAEDPHDGVFEVLVGQPRKGERIPGILGVRVVHDDALC